MSSNTEQRPNIATRIIWNVRPVALWLAVFVFLVPAYVSQAYLPAEWASLIKWVTGALSLLVILTIPLSTIVEPDLSSWWYRREVAKNRARLARYGLTPEQYLAAIPASNALGQARAKADFDIN